MKFTAAQLAAAPHAAENLHRGLAGRRHRGSGFRVDAAPGHCGRPQL